VSRLTTGIDIGGTKMLAVALADDGRIVTEARDRTPDGVEHVVAAIVALVERVDPRGSAPIGIGVAGLVDYDGRLRYAPNLPTVVEAPIRDLVAHATGRDVAVDNDANLAALGEVTYGAASGAADALMVTLGTGIGGGIVLGGRVLRGAHGFAGEIGHLTVERGGSPCACGETGHWESIASGSALGAMARALVASGRGNAILAAAGGDAGAVDGHHVTTAMHAGDPESLALLDDYADNVAVGLAGLANVLDPELIVLGGGVVEIGEVLLESVTAAFSRRIEGLEHRPRVPIVAAQLGEHAGAIGAGVLARSIGA
jgi:glucokinase